MKSDKLIKLYTAIILLVATISISLVIYFSIYEAPKYRARQIKRVLNELDENIIIKVGD